MWKVFSMWFPFANFGNLKFIGYFWTWQCIHDFYETFRTWCLFCGLLKFSFFRFTTSTEHTSVSRNLARQQARHKQRSRRQRKIPAHLQVTKPILLSFENNVQSSRNRSNVCVEKWYDARILFCRAALTLCLPWLTRRCLWTSSPSPWTWTPSTSWAFPLSDSQTSLETVAIAEFTLGKAVPICWTFCGSLFLAST